MACDARPSAGDHGHEPDSTGEIALGPQALELTHVAQESFRDVSEVPANAHLGAVQSRVARRRAREKRRPVVALAAAVALALAIGSFGRIRGWRNGAVPISYRTEGVAAAENGGVRALPGGASRVLFSDGSVVEMSDGSRLQMTSLEPEGAGVGIEDGTVRVDVVHRPDTRWRFDAGPFRVFVKGTQFDLTWSRSEEKLEIRLSQGQLAVKTPLSEEPIALTTGQRLLVRLSQKQVIIDQLAAGQASDALPTPPSAGGGDISAPWQGVSGNAKPLAAMDRPSSLVPRHATRRDPPNAASSGRSASWATYLAEGRLQEILDEAERRGLEATMHECTSEDLAALADAARYKGRSELAERALQKQRARFPGSVRARDAAFQLGRLHESRGSAGLAGALGWYDRYLIEAPAGSYAAEALGRKMTATERLSGKDAARPIAVQYLERYPTGAYAQAARALAPRP